MATVFHAFGPVFDGNSRVLILGTMPSPASREAGFYYGHPRNRFWPVLARLFAAETPETTEERRRFVLERGVALWDVLLSCEINNAADASIRKPVANDLTAVLDSATVRAVFTTGRKAAALFERTCAGMAKGVAAVPLPSTSPANARCSFDDLVEAYRVILQYIP